MFCENCGKEITDDRRFCDECEPIQTLEDTMPSESDVIVLNHEGVIEEKKPFNWKPLAVVGAIIVAIIILVACLWKPASEAASKSSRFATAQEHFAYVEGNNAQNLADRMAAAYGNYLAAYDFGSTAAELEIHFQVNEFLLNVLGSSANMDISWLSDIGLVVDVTGDENASRVNISIGLGNENIISADMIIDSLNQKLYMTFPELNNTYIEIDMETPGTGAGYSITGQDLMAGLLEIMPSEQVVQEILNKYLGIIVSNITDVTRTSRTVTIEGISQHCTILEAKIDYNVACEIVSAVLTELKNDQDLKSIICDIATYIEPGAGEYLSETWESTIDGLITDLYDPELANDPDYYLWTIYLDSNDKVIGRAFTANIEEEGTIEFSSVKVSNGKSYGYRMSIADEFVLVGNGTENGNIISGCFELEISDITFAEIELSGVDAQKLANGEFVGTILVRPSAETMLLLFGVQNIDISAALTIKDGNEPACLDLLVDGQSVAKLLLVYKQKEGSSVQLPQKTIDSMNPGAMENWLADMDFTGVLENMENAGVPMEFIEVFIGILLGTQESV